MFKTTLQKLVDEELLRPVGIITLVWVTAFCLLLRLSWLVPGWYDTIRYEMLY